MMANVGRYGGAAGPAAARARRVGDAAPYPVLSELERAAGFAAEDHEDLGQDADRDFGRGVGADIQTKRGVDAGELLRGEAGRFQLVENLQDFPAAADHADVAHATLAERGGESFSIDVIVPADNDHGVVFVPVPRGDESRCRICQALVGSCTLLEDILAIFESGDVEAAVGGKFGDGLGTVAATHDEEAVGRELRLDQDGDLSAANSAERVRLVFTKGPGFQEGFVAVEARQRLGDDKRFEFTSANGAGDRAVGVDDHFGSGVAWDGALGRGDSGEGAGASGATRFQQRFEDVAHAKCGIGIRPMPLKAG